MMLNFATVQSFVLFLHRIYVFVCRLKNIKQTYVQRFRRAPLQGSWLRLWSRRRPRLDCIWSGDAAFLPTNAPRSPSLTSSAVLQLLKLHPVWPCRAPPGAEAPTRSFRPAFKLVLRTPSEATDCARARWQVARCKEEGRLSL